MPHKPNDPSPGEGGFVVPKSVAPALPGAAPAKTKLFDRASLKAEKQAKRPPMATKRLAMPGKQGR